MKNLEHNNLQKKEIKSSVEKGSHSRVELTISIVNRKVKIRISDGRASPILMNDFEKIVMSLLDPMLVIENLQKCILESKLDDVSQGAMLIFLDKILNKYNEQPIISPEEVFS